jgi:hypothetical protein
MPLPDYYWEMLDDEPDDYDYLPCVLCSHDMSSECGVGSKNYFGDGRDLCICCNGGEVDDDSDPNEYQPFDASHASTGPGLEG